MKPFTEVKTFGEIMPIGSKKLYRKHILEISRMRNFKLYIFILEVQTGWVLGFDTVSPLLPVFRLAFLN